MCIRDSYGFFPQDNCGTTYFAIQFQGVNELGFGDPAEARLAMALGHRTSGSCVPASGTGMAKLQAVRVPAGVEPVLVRSPLRENRFYRER